MGALAGGVAGFLNLLSLKGYNLVNPSAYYGALVGIFIYIISYYLAKGMLNINLLPTDKNKAITQGMLGYVMIFLFIWILYNTFCTLGYCVTI